MAGLARLLVVIMACFTQVAAQTPPPIELVSMTRAGFVGAALQGPFDQPVHVFSLAEFDDVFGASTAGLANPYLRPAVQSFFENGGSALVVVRTDSSPTAVFDALDALGTVDGVSMVAVPGDATPATQAALIDHCEQMGDRMALLDSQPGADVNGVLAQRAALESTNGFAALYYPWLEGLVDGVPTMLPPSGFVAGIWSKTDAHRSPVGSVAGVSSVERLLTSNEVEALVPSGVNPLRMFSADDVRVWGARTIASSLDWIYIAVRRQAQALEKSILEGTTWVLDEPNEPTLWSTVLAQVEDFLYTRYLAGWFTGQTISEAFFAQCGLTTMTQNDIDAGRTVIRVGFAPLRPAEFLVLTIVQQRQLATIAPARLGEVRLLPPVPNPFNPRTTIWMEAPRACHVTLGLYDVRGRLLRTLWNGSLAAGRHSVSWEAIDTAGRPVASGVYVVRLTTADGQQQTQKIALTE